MKKDVSKRAIILGTLLFLFLANSLGGCVRGESLAPSDEDARASLEWSVTESRDISLADETSPQIIRAAVDERFRLHRRLESVPVDISVDDGTVHLRGVVPGDLERSLAARLALDTRGVARIDNQLSVVPSDAPSTESRDERLDSDLERDVTRSLSLSRRLAAESVRAVVRRGVVRLIGIVESDGDRIYAGEIASGVPGIRRVKNGLVVQTPSARAPSGA